MYNVENIEATTLSDAWFQTVFKCIEKARDFKIDRGSNAGQKRLEFDYITIHIKHPEIRPLIPKLSNLCNIPDPVDDNYVDQYISYLMTGELEDGESYTYGQRMCEYHINKDWVHLFNHDDFKDILIKESDIWDTNNKIINKKEELGYHGYYLNQIELLIWTYKNKGFRNNQMTLQISQPSDMLLQDPPCLRLIDTRIQDGKLHFIVYFRSWDLWGGFPANLAAIQIMKEYIAEEIGVECGETIASSKGLHLYNYVWELAELIRGKTIEEFRRELKL